ncbi:hypothetical protein ACVITL_004629 [Rhizobium pisi]
MGARSVNLTISRVAPLRSGTTRAADRVVTGLAMGSSFRGFHRSGSGPCRSALRCGRQEPAEDGRFHRSGTAGRAKRVCVTSGGKALRRARTRFATKAAPAAPRRASGLETTGRRFRPQRKRRASRQASGYDSEIPKGRTSATDSPHSSSSASARTKKRALSAGPMPPHHPCHRRASDAW